MAKKAEILDEYQVSPRVILRRGDKFRVSGGPYWRLPNGEKVPMAARGVCTFLRAKRYGAKVYIEGTNKEGSVLLHVAGRRRNDYLPDLVCRPYKIRGRIRPTKKGTKRK